MSYIKDKGIISETELGSKLKEFSPEGKHILCVYTTRFCCTSYSELTDTAHLLELRAFDDDSEFKAVRSQIGKDFSWRYIDDEGVPDDQCYVETQYLDINKKATKGTDYVSIGGGHYEMPDEGYERVVIKHYGVYDDDDMLVLKDYRVVKFLREGEKYNG